MEAASVTPELSDKEGAASVTPELIDKEGA